MSAVSVPAVLRAARFYLGLGWVLTRIPPRTKGPVHLGWNAPAEWIDTLERAEAQLGPHSDLNLGLIHGPSRTVAIDVDDEDRSIRIFADHHLDLHQLRQQGLVLQSARGTKAIYGLPAGLRLPTYKHVEPGEGKPRTILELRSGLLQDVVPPSVHPSGVAYRWLRSPHQVGAVPLIPDALVTLWQRLAAPPVPAALPPARREPPPGGSVITRFNAMYTVTQILEEHGYRVPRRGGGGRLRAPGSETHAPGLVILSNGKAYSHHAADPLAGPHAHDAFSCFTILEHGGDVRAAVKAAAKLLELSR
jgi:hypothetical protein